MTKLDVLQHGYNIHYCLGRFNRITQRGVTKHSSEHKIGLKILAECNASELSTNHSLTPVSYSKSSPQARIALVVQSDEVSNGITIHTDLIQMFRTPGSI